MYVPSVGRDRSHSRLRATILSSCRNLGLFEGFPTLLYYRRVEDSYG